jgi:hypothetical protein
MMFGTQQFDFSSKIKTFLFAGMGIGALSLLIGLLTEAADTHHAETWTNLLHNSVFFLGISFVTLFLYSASTTAWGGWFVGFKRVWEAMFGNMLLFGGIFLVLIVGGTVFGFHHLYHWAEPGVVENDTILKGKAGFLNKTTYGIASLVIIGIWAFFASKLRGLSLQEDRDGGLEAYDKIKYWAAAFMPVGAATSAFAIWWWLMSLDAHWFSTMYAWQGTSSFLVSAVAITVLTLIFLKKVGYMEHISEDHLHDLGKYMFAFSVFWTYLWFSQFMLIWYCNNGEETVYFKTRLDHFPALFYGNLLVNFVAPFFILLKNDNKRRFGVLTFAACLLLFGHWMDFFQMIKPAIWESLEFGHAHVAAAAEGAHEGAKATHEAAEHTGYTYNMGFRFPGLVELGTFVGFASLYLFGMFRNLAAASMVPANDPYMEESAHHHV